MRPVKILKGISVNSRLMKSGFILSLLVSGIIFDGNCQQQVQWKETWADHFSGNTLSEKYWQAETGTGNNGWGNQELQFYTADESNLQVRGGELRIIAKKEENGGRSYTSARIKTQDLKYWQYGRIEASIKLPWSKGLWPAFWMLGQDISGAGWPKCGEIDIMEHVNEVPEINGTMHWDSSGRKYHGGTIILDNPKEFHLYAVEWDPEKITWFLDGTVYHTEYIGKNMESRTEFHGNFFLLLNLAVGGDWPGSPDSTSVFPDTLHVDFVRVLKKEKPGSEKDGKNKPADKAAKQRMEATDFRRKSEGMNHK